MCAGVDLGVYETRTRNINVRIRTLLWHSRNKGRKIGKKKKRQSSEWERSACRAKVCGGTMSRATTTHVYIVRARHKPHTTDTPGDFFSLGNTE